jgi:ribonuclease J
MAKLSKDEFKTVSLTAGDTVIFSSRTIPGNEKAILEIKNSLVDLGIKIIEDGDALVHVSGHPRRAELKQMYAWTRPKIGVPVHGEPIHLVAQGSLMAMSASGRSSRYATATCCAWRPAPPRSSIRFRSGRLYKDGRLLGTDETMGVRDRRKLSLRGMWRSMSCSTTSYELAGDPDIVAIGVAYTDKNGEDLEDLMLDAAVGAIESIPRQRRKDLDLVQESVRRAVRGAANDAWGKKPLVTVFVTR